MGLGVDDVEVNGEVGIAANVKLPNRLKFCRVNRAGFIELFSSSSSTVFALCVGESSISLFPESLSRLITYGVEL